MVNPLHKSSESVESQFKSEIAPANPLTQKAKEVLQNKLETKQDVNIENVKIVEVKSSPDMDLPTKAKKDVDKTLKELTTQDLPIADHLVSKVETLKQHWGEPHLYLMNPETAVLACETNDLNNGARGSYLLSIDPKNSDMLQATFYVKPNAASGQYQTFLIPITKDQQLTWERKAFSNPKELIQAFSDKMMQPLLQVSALKDHHSATILSDLEHASVTPSDVKPFIGALKILMSQQQQSTAEKLFKRVLNENSENSQAFIDQCIEIALKKDDPQLIQFIVKYAPTDALNNIFQNLSYFTLQNSSANTLETLLSAYFSRTTPSLHLFPILAKLAELGREESVRNIFNAHPQISQSWSSTEKMQIAVHLLKEGTSEEFEKINTALHLNATAQEVIEKAFELSNVDITPVYAYIKKNEPTLDTPQLREKILSSALSRPATLQKLLEQFPEFLPLKEEHVIQALKSKEAEKNVNVLLKFNPPLSIEVFKAVKRSSISAANPLIQQIQDEKLALSALIYLISVNAREQVKLLLNKFPHILENSSSAMAALSIASQGEIVYDLLEKIPQHILEKHHDNSLANKILLKYLWAPQGNIKKITEFLEKDSFAAESVFMECAKCKNDYQSEDWKKLINTHWNKLFKTSSILYEAVNNRNEPFLKLLQDSGIELKNVYDLIPLAMMANFVEFLKFLPETFPSKTVFEYILKYNNPKFAIEYLKLKPEEKQVSEKMVDAALEEGCLSVSIAFSDREMLLSNVAQKMSQLSAQEIKKQLMLYFLNSHTEDVAELITLLSSKPLSEEQSQAVKNVATFMQTGGKLIARFPEKYDQNEMHAAYGKNYKNYLEQQEAYGKNRYALYSKVLEGVKSQDWHLTRVLSLLGGFTNENSDFSRWRNYNLTSFEAYTEIKMRYSRFDPLIHDMDKKINPHNPKPTLGPNYNIDYTLSDGSKLKLTTISTIPQKEDHLPMPTWIHTKDIVPALQEFSSLFEKIKTYPLRGDETTLPPDLKEMIVRAFWLGAQTMATTRNFSQIMLEIHSLLHEIVDFTSGPPSMKHVLADGVALSTPFEEFYQSYYDELFEAVPKPNKTRA